MSLSVEAGYNQDQSTVDRLFALFDQAEQTNLLTIDELHQSHHETVSAFVQILQNTVDGLAVWLDDGTLHRKTVIGQLPDPETSSQLIRNEFRNPGDNSETVTSIDQGDQRCVLATSLLCPKQSLILETVVDSAEPIELDEALRTFARILAADYQKVLLGNLLQIAKQSQASNDFFHSIHSKHDPQQIAVDIANDAAELCDADRVSVVFVHRGKAKLAAATSVIKLEHRAQSVADIATLVEQHVRQSDSQQALTDYCKAAGTIETRVEPLEVALTSTPAAFMVIDQFDARPFNDGAIAEVVRQSGLAMRNARSWHRRGFHGFRSIVNNRGWQLVGLGLLAFAFAMYFVRIEFSVSADGVVQPVEKRIGFAPDNGIIVEVMFEDEDLVSAKTPLLRISSPSLELKEETISGEYETTVAKLASVEAARVDPRRNSRQVPQEQLTAEKEELEKRKDSLSRQLGILRGQLKDLTITAQISGMVRRQHFQTELLGQPVERGQPLFEIFQPDGKWQLELRIPDRSLRHVIVASKDGSVQVDYRLHMSPESTWTESLSSIAAVTDMDEAGRLSSLATATLTNEASNLRPGAGVIANVHCGQRRLGYVWFREFLEFVQIRLF